jgi:phospholipid/cholesterol/gamma-HCH transport system substrate-binding protein
VDILGVRVGTIDSVQPVGQQVKVTMSVDGNVPVPAKAGAVVVAASVVADRYIQLTPAYTGGPMLRDGAVIPQSRTAVPVEFDDLRRQLDKLTESLQPTQPGGVSPLGEFVNTSAENLRGQGAQIRDTVIKLSQAVSALGDHSDDIFGTVKNLSTLVSALRDSADLMRQLNTNLAGVTALLANDPDEVGRAITDLNAAVSEVERFLADNREAIGTTSDRLASISKALVDSLDDVKQTLHVLPNAVQNVVNIYMPAHGAITGILAVGNFANPITFLCGAIEAASRLNSAQAAKLCVQYLAPIIKNRQYNFPMIGANPFVTAQARPNEVTYSEDWMNPNSRPAPPQAPSPEAAPGPPPPTPGGPSAADVPVTPNPADGLRGMMLPPASR